MRELGDIAKRAQPREEREGQSHGGHNQRTMDHTGQNHRIKGERRGDEQITCWRGEIKRMKVKKMSLYLEISVHQ